MAAPVRADEPCRRVVGELVAADFVHRIGRFRTVPAGEPVAFTLMPDAAVEYLNAPADLRDLPLGTAFEFTLGPDADGRLTRAAAVRDRFTTDTRAGTVLRVEGVAPGVIRVSGGGPAELRVTDRTRVRKGDKLVTPVALSVGDEVLVNLAGGTPATCADVWVGRDEHRRATERQRAAHAAFVKARGLPGRVERTDGRTLTVVLFAGELAAFPKPWVADNTKPGKGFHVCVANDELRTWNPVVDQERGNALERRDEPAGGVRLVVKVSHMLEGFRRGHYVRLFPDGWPTIDQPFGEQLFHYGSRPLPPDLAEQPAREYPDQYPFRTDLGNAHLPWYRPAAGFTSPPAAEHRVFGELAAADGRAGRFRADGTGAVTEFQLLPGATVRSLGADAALADVPVGTRCRFNTYRDSTGAFRQVGAVADEVSDQATDGAVWRVEALHLADGVVYAARQPPGVRNDQGDPEQPPDTGRAELRVGPATKVWKGDRQITLTDLAVGDVLLCNRSGDWVGHPAVCTEVWVGADTHKKLLAARPKRSPR